MPLLPRFGVPLLLALIGCRGVLAQADSLRIDTLELPGATVRADNLPRTLLRTPAAVSRVTPRALGRDLALTPGDALSRVPGVSVQTGGLGTNRIVVRGQGARAPFTSNRVRAYLGAIPLTDGEGSTDLEDVDLSLLSAIDVVRGPAATSYGSGLGGVILLQPDFDLRSGWSTRLSGTAGSYGTLRSDLQLAYGGANASARLGYRRTQSDGFRQNSRYRRDNLSLLTRLYDDKLASRNHTDLQLLWTGVRSEIPSSLGETAFRQNREQAGGTWGDSRGYEAYDRIGFGVSRRQQLGEHWRLEASAFASTRRSYEPRPFNILRENTLATGTRAVLSFAAAGGLLRAALGGELFRDWYDWGTYENRYRDFPAGTGSVRGAQLSDNEEVRTQRNVFVQADVALGTMLGLGDPDRLTLTAGLAHNGTRYRLDDYFAADSLDRSGAYDFAAQLSPRVALRYELSPRWGAFAQVARGFSPPSVAETLTPEGRINPAIAPETGWNYELGLRGIDPDGRWSVDAVGYLLRVQNLLVARRTAEDAFVGVNAGRTRNLGLELAGRYRIGRARADAAGFGASLYSSYTLQAHQFVEFVDGDADFGGNAVTGVPRHQGAAGVDVWLGSLWGGHLGVRAVGRIPVDDATTTYAGSYRVVGAQVGRVFALVRDELTVRVTVGADNLLNSSFVAMVSPNASGFGGREPRYFYPGWPRLPYVRILLDI